MGDREKWYKNVNSFIILDLWGNELVFYMCGEMDLLFYFKLDKFVYLINILLDNC